MSAPNRMREIRRLTTEISTLNSRIREHVYRRAWDREVLQGFCAQLEAKKQRLEELRLLSLRRPEDFIRRSEDTLNGEPAE